MQKLDLNKTEAVFKKGDLANGLYLIAQGSVGIFMPTNESRTPDFIIPTNEIFGEMGVIDGELRMATARCMEQSQLLFVTKDEFDQKVTDSDIFVRSVVRTLSDRLRKAQKMR
ncbi:MAG: cyclic nucleotide-binding domain-containing protein [Paracoccaceae bacterium]|nr:cyclic nucleotide-binding domain-containing protein [Paracoccaceae bacterium]